MQETVTLSRIERKRQKNQAKVANRKLKEVKHQPTRMRLKEIQAKTTNQALVFESFYKNDVSVIHGLPGTGKSFITLFLSLLEMEQSDVEYKKIVILRSPVASREMGFLPGNTKEKMAEYEKPYIEIVNDLYNRADAWQILKSKGIIEFETTAFLRGKTFNNCIVILDEAQNNPYKDLRTVVTRFGENCKMIIIGDVGQDDITSERYRETSGLDQMMDVLRNIQGVGFIEMGIDDIVRSGFIRSFIIAESKRSTYSDILKL